MKYIAYFDEQECSKQMRYISLAAVNKLKYIFSIFDESGISLEVFSASHSISTKGFFKGKKYNLYNNVTVNLLPSFGCKSVYLKYIRMLLSRIMLTISLLANIKRNEVVFVYHSISFSICIDILKKVKRVRIILELEEIYQDVQQLTKREAKNEKRIIGMADAFLFPSKILNERFNVLNKPYTIVYGTYCVEKVYTRRFTDNRIHIVYSGTLDPRKGGAIAAAAAAEFLDEHYHIHILGFGSERDKEFIKNLISKTCLVSKCMISFDGELRGEEYIKFLQSCDIGLSTQNPNASFNATSFPSKILTYLANGLRVVSIRIPAVEETPFSDLIYFYCLQTPEEIANTIKHIDLTDFYDSRLRIGGLDMSFRKDLLQLLSKFL